jgi:DNA-directed RNA polymerase subunit RPC12/RpoP
MKLLVSVIISIVLFAVVALLLQRSKKSLQKNIESNFYEKRDDFFTKAERSFFGVLQQAVEPHYKIFGKVRLADVVKVKSGLSQSIRQTSLNRITSKHIDFVLCDPKTLAVVCAVELDDSSHQKEDRKHRDDFVDATLQSVGVPIVHFPVRQAYILQDLKEALQSILEIPIAISEKNEIESLPSSDKQGEKIANKPLQLCPKCGSNLVVKVAKQGKHQGKEFMACSQYPNCKTIIPIELSL